MPVTFSFGGAGHHFPFMLGVAHGLKTHFTLPWEQVRVHCISSGCSGAIALLLLTPDEIQRLVARAIVLTHHITGNDYYEQLIKNLIPYNTYSRVGERLVIGTTEIPLLRPLLYEQGYSSQHSLLNTLYASCRIPMITGSWHRELDGGFSHQYALHDENTVVITLKRRSHSDIAAREATYLTELLLPSRSHMWKLYEQGKRAVIENYDHIARKITAGLESLADPVYFQPHYR